MRQRHQRRRPPGRAVRTALLALSWIAAAGLILPVAGGTASPAAQAESVAVVPALTWSTLSPPTSPPALHGAAMAWDGDDGTLVLFGGVGSNGAPSADTWVWDGTTWRLVTSTAPPPPARSAASLSFDPQLHQLILFGGLGAGGQLLGDTWAWNGQSWTALNPVASPPAREAAALADDPDHHLVLEGGTGAAAGNTAATVAGGTAVLGDTWTWDGTTWSASLGAGGPGPRTGAAAALDVAAGRTILVGGTTAPAGTDPSGGLLADTWVWDGSLWTVAAPAVVPPARSDAVLVDDPDAGGAVLVGGDSATGALGDAWVWDGSSWTALATASALAPRQDAAGGFDQSGHQLVVYGGVSAHGGPLGDTVVLAPAPVPAPPASPTTTAPASGPVPTTRPGTRSGAPTPPTTRGPSSPTTRAAPTRPTAGRTPGPTQEAARPSGATGHIASSLQTLHRGALVTLTGSGFRPGALVTVTFHSTPTTVGRTTADARGAFSLIVAIPDTAVAGAHHLVATGLSPGGPMTVLSTPVQVVSAVTLTTRSAVQTIVLVGLALLIPALTWLGLDLHGRRRRRSGVVA